MAIKENKALIQRVLEAVQQGNLAVLDEHPGLQELAPTFQRMRAEVPDAQFTIHEQVAEKEWVATRATVRGTRHPAGTPLEWEVIMLCRIVDGTIVTQHSQADAVNIQRQMEMTAARGLMA